MPRHDRYNRRRSYSDYDERFRSPNPAQLYRSPSDKVIGGVFGGMAERFGWDSSLLRLAAIVAFFMTGVFPFLLGYLIAMMVIPMRPFGDGAAAMSEEDTAFWRDVADRPKATFGTIRYTFMDLEERLRTLESAVTSDDWRLRKAFEDLEDDKR